MEHDALPDLSVYYCCHKCHGLLPDSSPDAAINHVTKCDAGMFKSSCNLFAVDKQLCLLLRTTGRQNGQPLLEAEMPEGQGRMEDCQDGGTYHQVIVKEEGIGSDENMEKNDAECIVLNTLLCGENNMDAREDSPPTTNVPVGQRVSARIANSGSRLAKLRRSSLHKEARSGNDPDTCVKTNSSTKTKVWMERREALEKKYNGYVVSAELANGQKSKLKYAKLNNYYQCPQCEWKTSHVGHFERHLRHRHDNSGLFQCSQCEFSCVDSKVFRRHKNHHDKPFVCDECDERFTFKKDLQRHVWKHSGLKPFKCEHCDFTTRFKETMTSHMRKHTGEKLGCDHEGCNFTTIHPSSLRIHKSVKHPSNESKVYQCDMCPYNTLNHGTLTEHKKRHTSEKNFYCSLCDYKGISKAEVIKHMNIHTKETQYFCDKCSYTSGHRTAFVNHMRTHSGMKPFQCSACGYSSITKQKVLRHITHRRPCNGASVYQHKDNLRVDLTKYQHKSTMSTFHVETVGANDGEYNTINDGVIVVDDTIVDGIATGDITVDNSVLQSQEVDADVVTELSFTDTTIDITIVDDAASHCTVVTDSVLQGDVVTCLL
ncbi:hypothetical protein LSH36_60g06032 [Paralvinella palmiformis]|uniref:C2H2-type domain-containing protein n=1 Tax=Paralvinella palmiformis TaxID=53620 RepID=A0AAD9K5D9_9ANNE|nr:hypothetical protein LSH36_60g06032 [Paralvinella palmiformis]